MSEEIVNIGFFYDVKRGHESEFERQFSDVLRYLKENGKGIKDAKLYREVDSSQYLILSTWESVDAFREFVESEAFKSVTHSGAEILNGKPYHRIFLTHIPQ
ncbi:hypothetical protein GCM10007108_05010 [Thermogymnomonas acidicola]|uniref:ABM domain-containing protein n=1 Tax=Thermogymnomonas acidicola TaxID=399579 RepID=A0AA37BQJ0_9ARCH|nr:antibiotic biosynthesis monooxygenase [Thermogymnomonas acidicola]GGM69925.1 hypothetical protein GCM10007108_05010 [Thermogymnomonas acidicola]